MISETVPHEPDEACHRMHCYSCGVDEPDGGYITCGECFHVYRTAGELRRAYRRRALSLPVYDVPRWRIWRHALTIRAKKIYFCQHCTHDF